MPLQVDGLLRFRDFACSESRLRVSTQATQETDITKGRGRVWPITFGRAPLEALLESCVKLLEASDDFRKGEGRRVRGGFPSRFSRWGG